LFIRIHGRISSIDAPVVPITFANTAPMKRNRQLINGIAWPFTRM
jgi:hypothetical protein